MGEENSFFITDSNNHRREIFLIKQDTFDMMQAKGQLSFCQDIFDDYDLDAWVDTDGKVVVQEGSKYAMYPSLGVLYEVLKGYAGPYSKELLDGLNMYGEQFPVYVDRIISKMLNDFSIDPNLNYKEQLKLMDAIIVEHRSKVFVDSHMMGFIALIGRHNINEFSGSWVMTLADDKKTWTPGRVGHRMLYFADYISEDFMDLQVGNPATQVDQRVRDVIRINILNEPYLDI
jgi:hypothetical protein